MDTLSHGLYGGIAFGRKSRKDYIYSFLFGVAPDLLAFGPLFLSSILGFREWPSRDIEPPGVLMVPEYIYRVYDFTHSLIIFGIFFAVVWFLFKNRKLAMLSLAWPLHILIDIPTHSAEFFPTPIFWPVSRFSVDGFPWATPYIIIPNTVLVITLYIVWYIKNKKAKAIIS